VEFPKAATDDIGAVGHRVMMASAGAANKSSRSRSTQLEQPMAMILAGDSGDAMLLLRIAAGDAGAMACHGRLELPTR
jgi:hypothetical protein